MSSVSVGNRVHVTIDGIRLRTSGVNTNTAAAKVILTDWGKGTPRHFLECKSRSTEVPKQSLCHNTYKMQ